MAKKKSDLKVPKTKNLGRTKPPRTNLGTNSTTQNTDNTNSNDDSSKEDD